MCNTDYLNQGTKEQMSGLKSLRVYKIKNLNFLTKWPQPTTANPDLNKVVLCGLCPSAITNIYYDNPILAAQKNFIFKKINNFMYVNLFVNNISF